MQHSNIIIVAAILCATCSATGCSTAPPRTEAEREADAALATRVEAALNGDPRIFARHIDVTVDNRVVHLGGYVWEDDELQFAKSDAAAVPGVKLVADQMELMRGGAAGTGR